MFKVRKCLAIQKSCSRASIARRVGFEPHAYENSCAHAHTHTRTHTHTHTHTRTCTRPAPPAGPNETGGKAHPPKTKAPVPQGSIYPTGTRFHIPDLIARYEERGSYRKTRSWANCDEFAPPYRKKNWYRGANSSQLAQLPVFRYDPRSSYLAIRFLFDFW